MTKSCNARSTSLTKQSTAIGSTLRTLSLRMVVSSTYLYFTTQMHHYTSSDIGPSSSSILFKSVMMSQQYCAVSAPHSCGLVVTENASDLATCAALDVSITLATSPLLQTFTLIQTIMRSSSSILLRRTMTNADSVTKLQTHPSSLQKFFSASSRTILMPSTCGHSV